MHSSYRRAFAQALLELGDRVKNLVVLDADVRRSTGAMLFAEKFPDRYINVGIKRARPDCHRCRAGYSWQDAGGGCLRRFPNAWMGADKEPGG